MIADHASSDPNRAGESQPAPLAEDQLAAIRALATVAHTLRLIVFELEEFSGAAVLDDYRLMVQCGQLPEGMDAQARPSRIEAAAGLVERLRLTVEIQQAGALLSDAPELRNRVGPALVGVGHRLAEAADCLRHVQHFGGAKRALAFVERCYHRAAEEYGSVLTRCADWLSASALRVGQPANGEAAALAGHRTQAPIAAADPERPENTWATDVGLAERHGLPLDPLRETLKRWRKVHVDGSGWRDIPDRKPREPGYLYYEPAVWDIVLRMRARAVTSERPAKKIP